MKDTFNVVQAKRVVDMAKNIALLNPDATPLTVLLKNIASEACYSPKFEWLEYEPAPVWDAVNNGAGYIAGATDIVVDNSVYFSVNDIVKVPRTGEAMRITAINTGTNTLTVVRGFGETGAVALVDNDPLLIIGNASAEGSNSRAFKRIDETPQYNYTEIFKTSVEVSGTLDASKLHGGNDRDFQRKVKGIEHMLQIERALLFGERKEDTTNKIRTTRGLTGFLNQNVVDAGGTLTEDEFEGFCEVAFKNGSKKKLLLSSPKLVSVINRFAGSKLQTLPKADTYGVAISKYVSAHGEILIAKSDLLEGSVYGGYGMMLDTANIKYKYLNGRDTKLEKDIHANDFDGAKDQYITEAGLQVMLPKTHAILKNVTG